MDVDDLLTVINQWGPCAGACPPSCLGDISGNCNVDVDDLLMVINAWGDCPACQDELEPNNFCFGTELGTLESNGGKTSVLNANLAPVGDSDWFHMFVEDGGTCFQDFIKVHVTLTVPAASGGSYQICSRMDSCNGLDVCHTAPLGSTTNFTIQWLDECLKEDSRHVFLRIRQNAPVQEQCMPYELHISVEED